MSSRHRRKKRKDSRKPRQHGFGKTQATPGLPNSPKPRKLRSRRLKTSLPVTLTLEDNTYHLRTENISVGGIFVRTEEPLAVGAPVTVKLRIPDTGQTLEVDGVIAHRVEPNDAYSRNLHPGYGVHLAGLLQETYNDWSWFIMRLGALHDAPTLETASLLEPTVHHFLGRCRRKDERKKARLQVRMETVDELFDVLTHDISKGGMFILVSKLVPLDTQVTLEVVHPLDGSVLKLSGRVAHTVDESPTKRGIGIAFEDNPDERHQSFLHFIEEGMPLLDLEEHLEAVDAE